jgi:hypothetical protein
VYLNLKQLLLKQLLDFPIPAAELLDLALASPLALRSIFPQEEQGALFKALQHLHAADAITLDLHETGDLLTADDAQAFVRVIRKHWQVHGFCLCRADTDPLAWHRAANREGQPLLLWRAFTTRAGYRLLGPPLHGRSTAILRALVHVESASADELAHNPQVVPQTYPFNHPHAVQRMIARGQRLPAHGGPAPVDEGDVRNRVRRMHEQRYIREVAPGRYSVIRPTPPPGGEVKEP